MKHTITLDNIQAYPIMCKIAFEGVATQKHYKALYEIQSKREIGHTAAIIALMDNKEFADACVEFVNQPDNYSMLMEEVVEVYHKFNDILFLPNREADFVIDCSSNSEDREAKIYFFIEEGVEMDVEDNHFQLSRILEDRFTDTLLYNSGEGWEEYAYNHKIQDSICSKVYRAYRNFLADNQLLGENNE